MGENRNKRERASSQERPPHDTPQGFQDTSQQTKYLSDLWIYDCTNYEWYNPVLPPHSQQPDPRSSFSFLPNESGAVIFGGYSRVKSTTVAGKQTRGGSQSQRTVLKPMIHQDTWFLRITQPTATKSPGSAPTIRWERRKRPANVPNPPRAGATMAFHRGRGVLFGGVHDVEESEEGIDSEFFNTLFAWGIERNRFFQLTLRRPRMRGAGGRQPSDRATGKRERGKVDEAELLRNLAALEAGGSLANAQLISLTRDPEDPASPTRPAKGNIFEMPHTRFNAQLAVQNDVLYIYGGTYEKGDREFTFDEMWAIDLDKLDGVKEIFRREPGNWAGSEDEGEDDEGEDEDEDEDEDDEEDDEDIQGLEAEEMPLVTFKDISKQALRKDKVLEPPSPTTLSTPSAPSEPPEPIELTEPDPSLPHPRPFEPLRDFYTRTSSQWLSLLPTNKAITKEHRTEAFRLAEDKWWECREEIRALEDEQEDAGIGEVVGISERGGGEGVGRRR
ncbi:hypothetical protein GP486_007594 [Trichoglossum hirsutum]|uniref:DUF4110 domain-containing protein n=1 Tax=Trichoglossum hirsutum TaxID=265104 RepID=A0A9P8IFJ9_9PEZI|nr:hypothetical protein GP486_007594 [Trichoglossum hirsutum]